MFLNNSYFNVLRKIDKRWEEKSYSSPKNKFKVWKKRLSRSSSQSSKSRLDSNSLSSRESGLYSEDVNSGYYGDDEIDPCPRCNADLPLRGAKPNIDDYDVITFEVNVKKQRVKSSVQGTHSHSESINFDEFVVIPSYREDFCSGNFKHSTPIPLKNETHSRRNDISLKINAVASSPHVLVTCTPKIVTCLPHAPDDVTQKGVDHSCSCFSPQKPVRFRLGAPPRSSAKDNGVWWKENITWQLRQRNKTQTHNFMQLQDFRTSTKPKVKINREIADYLNKYGEFRPHNELLNTALVEMEPNAINKSDLLNAIRSHGGSVEESKVRRSSVAHLAQEYMKTQVTAANKNPPDTDEEDTSRDVMPTKKRTRSKSEFRNRLLVPRWKDSIKNQLQMRNFLECKYFTDAIVRRTLSQLSISVSQGDSKSSKEFDEYDVISDDEVTSLVMHKTLVNSSQSTSQGYHSAPTHTLINKYKNTLMNNTTDKLSIRTIKWA